MSEHLTSIEKIIEDAVKEAMQGDAMKEVIKKSITKSVESAVDACMSYRGAGYEVLKGKVNSLMVPFIEEYDYSEMLVTLDDALSQLVKSCSHQHVAIIQNFKMLMDPEGAPEKMLLSEMFNVYKAYVAHKVDTSELEVITDDEPAYMNITCKMDVEDMDKKGCLSSYEYKQVTFSCNEDDDMEYRIVLSKWQGSHYTSWDVEKGGTVSLDRLKYMKDMDIFFAKLHQNRTKVEIDIEFIEDDDVEVEAKPEASFS